MVNNGHNKNTIIAKENYYEENYMYVCIGYRGFNS
jgi:hypothetical protein